MKLTTKNVLRSVSAFAVLFVLALSLCIPAARAGTGAEWTVMVYLDGDNNLDPDSVDDINEMMQVGSSDKVNVIVLWDRYSEPAYLYKVVQGGLQPLSGLVVNGTDVNGQEVSMADWHILEAFVDYARATMPADHYMLDLWDHGSAYGYACWDDHADPGWATPDRAISLAQVIDSLAGTGMTDVLAYDGCTLGMIEIAYQLALIPADKDVQVGYLVASEEYIPNAGFNYEHVLQQMNDMTDSSAAATAHMLADVYAENYSPHGDAKGSSTVGLSAIDFQKIVPVVPVIKSLTDILTQGLNADFKTYHDMIAKARGAGNLGWSLNGWDDRIDIGAFLLKLSQIAGDQQTRTLAKQAFDMLVDAVYVANTPALASGGAYGLGVWFPTSIRSLGNANTGGYHVIGLYTSTFDFAEDAGWMTFLNAFWGNKLPK